MSHASEKLKVDENILVSRETLRRWCHEARHVKNKRRRRSKPRFRRDRVSNVGIMIQMDGSYHKWYGEKKSCLLAAIDDADSSIRWAQFVKSETTFACMDFLKALIKKHGLFKVLYVDRAGVYGSHKRAQFTQLQRACDELGIQVVFASSPQAKGRVERLFRTLQDRLIAEMHLKGIVTRSQANHYLQKVYIPHEHNPRFACEPLNGKSMYAPVINTKKLDEVLCFKQWRKIYNDHTISIDGTKYKIVHNLDFSMARYYLEVRFYPNGNMAGYFAGKQVQLEKINDLSKKKCA